MKNKKLNMKYKKSLKKKKSKFGMKHLIMLMIIFVILSIYLTTNAYYVYKRNRIYATRTVPINLTVTEPMHVGIGIRKERDMIFFGAIPPNGKGMTKFDVSSYYEKNLLVNIKVIGELESWINISENNFILKPNETKTVTLWAYIPENATLGQRNSTLSVTFLKI